MGKLAERLKQLPQASRLYKLQVLPKLLSDSSRVTNLYILLTDFDFIEAKISELGPQPLIEDYDLAFTPNILNSEEWVKSKGENLRIIQSALRLSAHILEQNKMQLAGRLWGHLMPFDVPEIKVMLEEAEARQIAPWLRPLTPTLTPPGGALLRTFGGHNDWVNAVAITPDGKQAVSASSDQTLIIWDLQSGTLLKTLAGHTQHVNAVAITSSGKKAVSGASDNTLKIWNLQSGRLLKTLRGHTAPVRAVAITPNGQQAVSASVDKTLKIWNLQSGRLLKTLRGHTAPVRAVA
ncbi:hypothetical protein QUB77_27875, partial [Microcoleus sp. AT9b-C3]